MSTKQDEMLSFLVLAPKLKHLLLQEDDRRHRLPMPMLQQEWRKFAVAAQPVSISSLQTISTGYLGPHEEMLLGLANIVSLQIDQTLDTAVLARVAALLSILQ